MTSPEVRFDRALARTLRVYDCDTDREHRIALRIARTAFLAGWVARGRMVLTASHPSSIRRDGGRAWKGK